MTFEKRNREYEVPGAIFVDVLHLGFIRPRDVYFLAGIDGTRIRGSGALKNYDCTVCRRRTTKAHFI